MKLDKYSVVLLKEGIINKRLADDHTKIFEESIVLCSLSNNFFDDTSYDNILKYFKNNIPSDEYKNSYEEIVSNEIVAVIDSHIIQSNIRFDELSEVYSRYFIEEEDMVVEDIIRKYYFDFSLSIS